VLALVAVGASPCACRSTRAPAAVNEAAQGASPGVAGAVAGRVVDLRTHRPLAGRTVAIGAVRAVTDQDGRFNVAGVPASYDATVVEPDRATASVYRGLHRRDPLLVHRGLNKNEARHLTEVVGVLDGAGPVEKWDYVIVAFISREGTVFDIPTVAPGLKQPTYPRYGPLRVIWSGPDTIAGELVALFMPGAMPRAPAGAGGGRPPLLAHAPVTLHGGQIIPAMVRIDEQNCADLPPPPVPPPPPTEIALTFAPVQQQHVALTVEAPYLDSLSPRYRFPALHAELGVARIGPTDTRVPTHRMQVEADLPDLRPLGAVLCIQAVANHREHVETCAFPTGAPALIRPRPAPKLSAPAGSRELASGKTLLGPATRLSWTPFQGGVEMLAFEAPSPSTDHPSVYVFTEDRGGGWPDLSALGVRFPDDFVTYDVGVSGFGPYASLDQAIAPDGIGAETPIDHDFADGAGIFNAILSPTGAPADEYTCGATPSEDCGPAKPYCNCGPGCTCSAPCEWAARPYPPDFTVANRLLALHPALTRVAGLRCVRDCEALRTLRAAYKPYLREHPRFQESEPLPGAFR
jgi:hypothetical protein